MAISQPTALVQQVRNKVADQVFYIRNGVTYARARVSPDQTRTPARDAVRTRLHEVATIYRDDLTSSQRLAWAEAAKTIGPRPHRSGYGKLTGWMYFHNVNLVLENIGVGTILDPPQRQKPDPILTLSVNTLDATTQTLKLDATGAAGPNTYIIIYATGNTGTGRLSPNGTTRQVAVIAPLATRPIDISAAWTSKFGTLLAGSRVIFQAAAANAIDGTLSARAYATAIAEAQGDAMQLIQDQLLAADTPSVQFAAIPQTYKSLWLQITARSTYAAANDELHGTFNADTTAIYNSVFMDTRQGLQSVQAWPNKTWFSLGAITAATADANQFGQGHADLLDYTRTDVAKLIVARLGRTETPGSGGTFFVTNATGANTALPAISSIELFPRFGPNIAAGSRFTLYGVS